MASAVFSQPAMPIAASQSEQSQQPALLHGEQQNAITIDTQHDDMIHDSQFDYYGVKLATCSSGTYWLFT